MCVNLERFLRKVVHISISPLSIALNLSNLFNRFLDTQFYRKIFDSPEKRGTDELI